MQRARCDQIPEAIVLGQLVDPQAEEEKEIYYSITAEMILAQPSSHSVQTTPVP